MSLALDNFRAAKPNYVTLSGIQLSYRSFGAGPAVLMLHGWPLSGVTYRYLIESLQGQYRCIVPDLPGTGTTPWSAQISDSIYGYADLMHKLVEALGLDRLALIGHDSGGGVARVVAAELGERASCLILQNTEVPNHVPMLVRALKLSSRSDLATTSMERLLASPKYRRSRFGFGECFGDRSLIEAEFLEACVRPLLQDLSGHVAMMARLDLSWTRRLPDVHRRIRAPIHLFWGGADRFFPLERARAMMSEFGVAGELEVVPNAKLYVHEEAPERLARFCVPLLQSAFAPSSGAVATPRAARLQS